MFRTIYWRYTFFLLLIAVFILFGKTIFTLSQTLTPDFSVYYNAANNMLLGQSVYVGHATFTLFAYPLMSAMLFIPFTFFPYIIAQNIFLLLNVVALIVTSYLIPKIIINKKSLLLSTIVFALSYLSFPTKFTLGMGQVNLIASALLLGSFLSYQKRQHLLTALLFTIACIAKPVLGFVLLFFLIKKDWRIIFIIAGVGLLFLFLSLFIDRHGLQDYFYYMQHVLPDVSRPVGRGIYYNQGIMSFIFRTNPLPQLNILLSYLGMAVVFIVGIVAIVKLHKDDLYQFSLLLTMVPLLDSMSWQHHFVFLILPFSYVTYLLWKKKHYQNLGYVFVAYILVSTNIKNPLLFSSFPKNLLLSNVFYGALLLFVLLVLNRNLILVHQKSSHA